MLSFSSVVEFAPDLEKKESLSLNPLEEAPKLILS
jgi:hypothetical protein